MPSLKQHMQLRKIRERFCELFIGEACQSSGKLAKACKICACERVVAQNAARESQNASRESVAKGACERRAH